MTKICFAESPARGTLGAFIWVSILSLARRQRALVRLGGKSPRPMAFLKEALKLSRLKEPLRADPEMSDPALPSPHMKRLDSYAKLLCCLPCANPLNFQAL
jgi:hypothetical protein